jgi:hypothetical protein
LDIQRNILDTHGEKEPCSCELKKGKYYHDAIRQWIPFQLTRNTSHRRRVFFSYNKVNGSKVLGEIYHN